MPNYVMCVLVKHSSFKLSKKIIFMKDVKSNILVSADITRLHYFCY